VPSLSARGSCGRPARAPSEGPLPLSSLLLPCPRQRPPKRAGLPHKPPPAGCSPAAELNACRCMAMTCTAKEGLRRRLTSPKQCSQIPGAQRYFPVASPTASCPHGPGLASPPQHALQLLLWTPPVRRAHFPTYFRSLVASGHKTGSHRQQQQAPGCPAHPLGPPSPQPPPMAQS